MSAIRSTEAVLVIRKNYSASREALFKAWTDPEQIAQWFSPDEAVGVTGVEVDLREGGRYRIGMVIPEAEGVKFVGGTYERIVPNEKLVFTWRWESWNTETHQDTLVTVELNAAGNKTELVLTHERFRDENMRKEHNQGWEGCLGRLGALFWA